MVGTIEAKNFKFPLSLPKIKSLLFEPNSNSFAFFHYDFTFSLLPSFPPFLNDFLPNPQTLISPFNSTSACFVPLFNPNGKIQDNPDEKRAVFVTAGSYNGRVVLRFYLKGKKDGKFGFTHVGCTQNGVNFDGDLGVIVDVNHGIKVMLYGDVNYLVLYSPSGGQIWVFGVKLVEDGKGLKLVKCAVIECQLAVSSICLSLGYLILGEMGGVRVFPLRALVKGRVGSGKRRVRMSKSKVEVLNGEERDGGGKGKVEGRGNKLSNGVLRSFDGVYEVDKSFGGLSLSKVLGNGHAPNALYGVSSSSNVDGSVKPKSLKIQQNSGEWGMQFVVFNECKNEGNKSGVMQYKTTTAISIQALSKQKFLIMDSNGDLHVLHVSKSGSFQMRQLACTIQVHKSAAFPDTSADSHTIWVSDGLYTVHVMVIPSSDTTEKDNDKGNNEGEVIPSSVTQVIFSSENIQNMVPLAANKVLILGQVSL